MITEPVKHVVDVSSIGVTILALLDFIPHITALLTLIWVGIRIYETKTFQRKILRKKNTRENDLTKFIKEEINEA